MKTAKQIKAKIEETRAAAIAELTTYAKGRLEETSEIMFKEMILECDIVSDNDTLFAQALELQEIKDLLAENGFGVRKSNGLYYLYVTE